MPHRPARPPCPPYRPPRCIQTQCVHKKLFISLAPVHIGYCIVLYFIVLYCIVLCPAALVHIRPVLLIGQDLPQDPRAPRPEPVSHRGRRRRPSADASPGPACSSRRPCRRPRPQLRRPSRGRHVLLGRCTTAGTRTTIIRPCLSTYRLSFQVALHRPVPRPMRCHPVLASVFQAIYHPELTSAAALPLPSRTRHHPPPSRRCPL